MDPMGPSLPPNFAFGDIATEPDPFLTGQPPPEANEQQQILASLLSSLQPQPGDPRIGIDPRTGQPVCTAEALETLETELPSVLAAYDSMMADHWQREHEIE